MSDIAFAAAACSLAQAIWRNRQRAYDLALLDWHELDSATRHLYVTQAGDILRANQPIGELPPAPSPLLNAFAAHTRNAFHVVKKSSMGTATP